MSAADLESRVEILCNIILKTDSENWDVKNKALLQMTELIISYDSQPPMVLQEAFSQNFFRLLKEPVKILVRNTNHSINLIKSSMHLFSHFI